MKKLVIVLVLILSICLSAFTMTSCAKKSETESLIIDLQTTISNNKTELDNKINSLTAEHNNKDSQLLAKITASEKALEDLKAEYDAKLKELQSENETFTKNVADLDAKYLLEIERLAKVDANNAEALENLKTERNAKEKELKDKNAEIEQKIANLDANYLKEVNDLKEKDAENEQALAKLKEEYDAKLKALVVSQGETKQDIANLDTKYLIEVENLAQKDTNNQTVLENLKTEFNNKLKTLQENYAKTKEDVANLNANFVLELEKLVLADNSNLEALENVKTEINNELKTLQENYAKTKEDVANLNAKYLLDIEELAKADANNIQALEDLKTEHEKALKELEDKDLLTDENIANLDAKYKSEVEKLVLADDNNLQALEDLRKEHDAKIKALQNKDEEILNSIEDLDNKLISEIEKLVLADENNIQVLEDLRTEYNSKLKVLEDKDEEILNSIEDLDNKLISEVEKLVLADDNNLQALADLRAEYNSKLKVLEDKNVKIVNSIEDLDAKYILELNGLKEKDFENEKALEDLKTEYNLALTTLENTYAETSKTLEDLQAKYLLEFEKLNNADKENQQAVLDLKTEYDERKTELQNKVSENANAIKNLEEKYLIEQEKLQQDIANVNAQINESKLELDAKINGVKAFYDTKLNEINSIIETLQNSNITQQDIINALKNRVLELEKGMQIKELAIAENGNIIIYFTDGSSQTIEKPQGHQHSFGKLLVFAGENNTCENKIFYRACETCKEVQFVHGTYNDHDFNFITIAPTCELQGYDLKICNRCGKEERLNFKPIIEHNWVTVRTDENHHWIKCTACETTINEQKHTLPNGDFNCDVCSLYLQTEGIEYAISNDGNSAKVVGYTGTALDVIIAKEFNGVKVTSIETLAFSNANLNSIRIPSSITTIENDAFFNCENLEKVIVQKGTVLNKLGANAFNYCTSIKEIELPASAITNLLGTLNVYSNILKVNFLGSIDEWAEKEILINFKAQNNVSFYLGYDLYVNGELLTNAVLTNATKISNYSFYGCKSLTKIEIPESVKTIGAYSFAYCVNLKTVDFKENSQLQSIGKYPFESCISLTGLEIPNDVTYVGAIKYNAQLSSDSIEVILGETHQLSVNNYNGEFSWASLNKDICSVSQDGVVTGLYVGSTDVIYYYEGGYLRCNVKVIDNKTPVEQARLNNANLVLYRTDKFQLEVLKNIGSQIVNGGSTTWTSSNPSLVKVSNTGLVEGVEITKKNQPVIITAVHTSGDNVYTFTCEVNVILKASINYKNNITLYSNYGVFTIKPEVTLLENSTLHNFSESNFEFSIEDETVAEVSLTGEITPKKGGKTRILINYNNYGYKYVDLLVYNKLIFTPQDFLSIQASDYSLLMNDLDFTNISVSGGINVDGLFNGNGYSLNNVTLVPNYWESVNGKQLFGKVTGEIKNLEVHNFKVKKFWDEMCGASSLIANCSGHVENVILDGLIEGKVAINKDGTNYTTWGAKSGYLIKTANNSTAKNVYIDIDRDSTCNDLMATHGGGTLIINNVYVVLDNFTSTQYAPYHVDGGFFVVGTESMFNNDNTFIESMGTDIWQIENNKPVLRNNLEIIDLCEVSSSVGVEYKAYSTYAEVIGYTGEDKNVLIATYYNGLPVTSIADEAFNKKSIENIILPNTISKIGYASFYGCNSLKTINMPSSLTRIGTYAFYGCTSLKEITLPSTIESIGCYAFDACNGLTSFAFDDYENWYGTTSSTDWKNKVNGTLLDFSSATSNVEKITSTYKTYYLYKKKA